MVTILEYPTLNPVRLSHVLHGGDMNAISVRTKGCLSKTYDHFPLLPNNFAGCVLRLMKSPIKLLKIDDNNLQHTHLVAHNYIVQSCLELRNRCQKVT